MPSPICQEKAFSHGSGHEQSLMQLEGAGEPHVRTLRLRNVLLAREAGRAWCSRCNTRFFSVPCFAFGLPPVGRVGCRAVDEMGL